MKKTIENIAKAGGALFFCALLATHYATVSGLFNIAGGIGKGIGSITLIILGQGDTVKNQPASIGRGRFATGDDGSGDGFESLSQYEE